MRILVHDYAGHPFQVQLSRELAARGHRVHHSYCGSVVTPRGRLIRADDDPETFSIAPLTLAKTVKKYSYVQRFLQDVAYGRLLAAEVRRFRPEVVLSANTPLDSLTRPTRACRRTGSRFVFWLQDFYSVAVERLVGRRIPLLGPLISWWYKRMERLLLKNSDGVVLITDDFAPTLREWGVDPARTTVVPNWAPLDEVSVAPKKNPWAARHGLEDQFVFMYTGTLGMKHDPSVLVALAQEFAGKALVVVVAELIGAEYLAREKAKLGLENLILLPFQPFSEMSNMLGASDVLVALLEPDAGAFSVPSKVLTYHCARRPLLLAVPADNLAARIVRETGSGMVVRPGDPNAFLAAARELYSSSGLREDCAAKARAYAEKVFDIKSIATRFEQVLQASLQASR